MIFSGGRSYYTSRYYELQVNDFTLHRKTFVTDQYEDRIEHFYAIGDGLRTSAGIMEKDLSFTLGNLADIFHITIKKLKSLSSIFVLHHSLW